MIKWFVAVLAIILNALSLKSQDADSLLAVIREKDQAVRLELIEAERDGVSPDEIIGIVLKMQEIDVECQEAVFRLLKNGIPDGLSGDSYETIWLVVQHSDLKSQRKYLPEFIKLSRKGLLKASDCATMKDRILMSSDRKQKYATQCYSLDGSIYLWPVKKPVDIERRRQSAGLPPMSVMYEAYKQAGQEFVWDKSMKIKDFR